jgi:predicted Zn-dependent protease
MRRFVCVIICSSALALASPAIGANGEAEGLKAEKMSPLRNLVSEEKLQAEAVQQYTALKVQAREKGVLAPDNTPQLVRLRTIAQKLIPHAKHWNESAAKWQWEVNLITLNQVNAFCMPGGKIAFFSGILDALKLTDDEVAIVMGHEMSHALREHARERMAKSALTSAGARLAGLGAAAIFGIDPRLTDTVAGGAARFAALKFSRSDETESDLVGLDLVARAGYDPRAGVALWRKMGMLNKSAQPQWLSTHPAGNNRIAQIQKKLPEVMPLFAKAKGTTVDRLPPYQSNVQGIAAIK